MFVELVKGEKYPANNAKQSTRADSFEDAGYLLKDDDLVVDIDCLDKSVIQDMIETFNIRTETVWTDRGAHLYFRKPLGFDVSEGITPLGFKAEYKYGGKHTCVTVRRNNISRPRENNNKRAKLPEVLRPNKDKFNESLVGLDESSGRNNKLFAWTNKVYSYRHRDKILRFINEKIFAEPLEEKEFETATRPRKISAGKDMEGEIADLVMRDMDAWLYNNQLYFRDPKTGDFINDKAKINRIVYSYCEGQKSRYIEEVIKQINMRCRIIEGNSGFPICFDNGYLVDGKFVPMTYTGFTLYNIHCEYDPEAEVVPIVDDYLGQLTDNDPDYRKRLLESLAHGLITDPERKRMLAKFFVFIGDGGNGKGTLLQVIRSIFGDQNCVGLTIEEIKDERYFNALEGKLFSLGDDVEDKKIDDAAMRHLKNVSSCDTVMMRRLYENSFPTQLTATLIFTSNHLIRSFEKGESYKRRVDWMPMYTKPNRKDPKFITKLTTPEAIRYWIKLIVEAYFRLYSEGFTECEKVSEYTDHYHHENDNTLAYLEDLERDEILGRKANDVYKDYEAYCDDEGFRPASRTRFYENVEKIHRVWRHRKRVKGYKNAIDVFESI